MRQARMPAMLVGSAAGRIRFDKLTAFVVQLARE